jgi:predicted Fe-Mo cluster-binding NifX family protein
MAERKGVTMAADMVIAIPVESGEGLQAVRSAHFGHAAGFVLVSVSGDDVREVRTIANPPHTQGGCMSTVNLLALNGVTAVTAGGMGGGPLSGLSRSGIAVYFDGVSPTVSDAVQAVLDGRVDRFSDQHVCQGH